MKRKKFRAKLSFSTDLQFEAPPTIAKKIISLGYSGEAVSARPRALRLKELPISSLPQVILKSADESVQIKVFTVSESGSSKRLINSDGDEVWYVWRGSGILLTSFGLIKFTRDDFIYIPKGILYRLVNTSSDKSLIIGIESGNQFVRPNFGTNIEIPYDNKKLLTPKGNNPAKLDKADEDGDYSVFVKRLGRYATQFVYSQSPFIPSSWTGALFPYVLHGKDINTVVSPTAHIDPSAFAVFATAGQQAVVSAFRPRWVHSLPYNHMNYWDEFLFYASKYEARGGLVGEGDATFHPQGAWHGPQIEAIVNENKAKKDHPMLTRWFEETAIMFESKKPLMVCDIGLSIELADYWKSWYNGWKKNRESLGG